MQTIDAALDGQGVALASDVMASAELASGRLVKLPAGEMTDGAYWLIWRGEKPRSGTALGVANWIKAEVGRGVVGKDHGAKRAG